MKNKTNELRDIEIEDLKNQLFITEKKLNSVVKFLLYTSSKKTLKTKAELLHYNEELNMVFEHVTMEEVLEDLLL